MKPKSTPCKPHTGTLTLTYWWRCDAFPKGIPTEFHACLDEQARQRAFEGVGDGATSGELNGDFDQDISDDSFKVHPCRGWWELKG